MHSALQITISDDQQSATMVVKKAVLEKQKELTYPGLLDVQAACEELNIVFGVDKDKIISNLKFKDQPIVIAKGKAMVQTIPDVVAYTFEDMRNKQFTPTILADDKANFYDLVKFKIAKKDELLVYVKKGRDGTKGMTVTGKEVIQDRYVEMTVDLLKKFVGKNTTLSPQGIISEMAGIPLIESSGKVHVDDTYIVKGDVDFSTGSIDYDGPVIVKGAVMNGFTVKSTKDIIIEGIVDGGSIEAGGMVTLLGGVNKGKIKCAKNIAAKYIYSSKIESGNNVIADEAILNSNILAKTVIAKGDSSSSKTGLISGGKITVSNYVWAKSLGSESANFTEIFVNSFIERESLELLLQEEKNYNENFNKIITSLHLLEDLKKKSVNLPPTFQQNYIKVMRTKMAIEHKLRELRGKIEEIQAAIAKEDHDSTRKVFVSTSLFAKVFVKIMAKKLQTMQEYGPSTIEIDKEDGNIKIKIATAALEVPGGN